MTSKGARGRAKLRRQIREDDLLGQPGLSRAAAGSLLRAQPQTVREALRIRGVGRKTTRRLLERGLVVDPDDAQHGLRERSPGGDPGSSWRNLDDRREVQKLLAKLKRSLPALGMLLEECNNPSRYEDGIYRFYHQSFKVYGLQEMTEKIVHALKKLSPQRKLNDRFMLIVKEGTGKKFEPAHNRRWLEVTRPMLEAFFHARYFLEMAVAYGKELKAPPALLPSGWAAFLYLYNLR